MTVALWTPGKSQQTAERRILETNAILADLKKAEHDGRAISDVERIISVRKLCEAGGVQTMEPLLPLMFNLNGHPYSLYDYFPFSPVFRTRMPDNLVLITGRQVSKSTSLAAHGVGVSNAIPHFSTLFVTPRYEQIRRFSTEYVGAFIKQSPVRELWTSTETTGNVLLRTFNNGSKMFFSFALLDVDRVRGIPAKKVAIDEAQDMDPDHIPIIRETMSASKEYGITQITGTPKTLDNFIQGEWMRSSRAEWFTPCFSCGSWNIASLEFHLEKMLGPPREDISEHLPGTICHKCRKPINPRYGRWVHRHPERRWNRLGLHVPQPIMPLHYAIPKKWSELIQKREGAANTAPHVFINEILGESSATGNQLVTLPDLQAAAILPWANNSMDPLQEVFDRLGDYKTTVMGIDWGGGGEDGVSFTVLSLLGFRADGKIDVLWGRRLLNPHEHIKEAQEILGYFQRFNPSFIAHDYTGAGILRETFLIQAGVPIERIIPIQYVRSATHSLMTFHPPTVQHQRTWYSLDKTRSLLYVTSSIKLKMIRFFQYDHKSDDVPGLIHDFLALIDEKKPGTHAGDIYLIKRAAGLHRRLRPGREPGLCGPMARQRRLAQLRRRRQLPTHGPAGPPGRELPDGVDGRGHPRWWRVLRHALKPAPTPCASRGPEGHPRQPSGPLRGVTTRRLLPSRRRGRTAPRRRRRPRLHPRHPPRRHPPPRLRGHRRPRHRGSRPSQDRRPRP